MAPPQPTAGVSRPRRIPCSRFPDFLKRVDMVVERGVFYGLVDDIDGLRKYESDTADGIEKAFRDAVDDYIDACRESETTNDSSVL